MSKIEENLKKYFLSKSLPDEKVDLLLSGETRTGKSFANYFKYAAAVVIIFALFFGYFQFEGNELEMRVAKEIAMNHNKQLAVEYSSDNLSDLGNKLNKLDFKLANAASGIPGDYELIGGRYCSIQGNLAAQLKIENLESNKVETLYISEINGELEKIRPTDVNMEGVNIRIWKKDGL